MTNDKSRVIRLHQFEFTTFVYIFMSPKVHVYNILEYNVQISAYAMVWNSFTY